MGTVKYTGPMASFHCPTEAEIRSLKVHFSPKQEGIGDPSPENVRKISGWNNIAYHKCKHIRKITPANFTTIVNNGVSLEYLGEGVFSLHGECTSSRAIFDLDIEPFNLTKQDHYFSFFSNYCNSVSKYDIAFGIKNINNELMLSIYPISNQYNTIFSYLNFDDEAIEYLSNNTCQKIRMIFKKDVTNITFSLIFSDSLNTEMIDFGENIGEIYGGWVDLITGELVAKWVCINIPFDKTWNYSSSSYYLQDTNLPVIYSGLKDFIISHHKNTEISPTISIYISSSKYWIFGTTIAKNLNLNSSEEINAWLKEQADNGTPVQICGTLAPSAQIHYSLTPHQLTTFLGQNNIWSNADYVEVEYDLHETQNILARKHFIMANQPHIESASGTIASFTTDLAAPLKECKIHFSPIQEGSGDPSPNNVRLISGWDNIYCFSNNKITLIEPTNSWQIPFLGANIHYLGNGIYRVEGTTVDSGSVVIPFSPVIHAANETYSFFIKLWPEGSIDGSLNFGLKAADNKNYPLIKNTQISDYYGMQTRTYTSSITVENFAIGTTGVSNIKFQAMIVEDNTVIQPIDWSSTAGTIYGGYVDLINGEVVAEWIKRPLDDSTKWIKNSDALYYNSSLPYPRKKESLINLYCSFVPTATSLEQGNPYIRWASTTTTMPAIHINESSLTLEKVKELSDNGQAIMWYELAEPIHYPISSTALTTLRGTNNIWSNANGDIELSYWKH